MAKSMITGIVVSTKMKDSVVVEVTRKTPHPLYKKLITVSKRYVVDSKGVEVKDGDTVLITETRKIGGNKHYKIERKVQ